MRFDREAWESRLELFDNLGRGLELSFAVALIAGLAVGGVAALVGAPFPSALILGALAAVGVLALHWVRSRRRGTPFLGDE